MTNAPQPTAGSLEARIIRACPTHRDCPLTCKQRRVEELGTIASFDTREPGENNWRSKFKQWMQEFSQERTSES